MTYPRHWVRLVLSVCLLLGCGDGKEGGDGPGGKQDGDGNGHEQQSPELSRAALVDRLIAQGDALARAGKAADAKAVYSMALVYAPGQPGLADKHKAMEEEEKNSPERDKRIQSDHKTANRRLIGTKIGLALKDWPASTPEMALVELRILTDGAFLKHFRKGLMTFGSGPDSTKMYGFIARPQLSPDELAERYGEPTSRIKPDGGGAVTYGRIRVLTDKEDRPLAAFFRRDD